MTMSGIAGRIESALSVRYSAPEWAFLTQVRNGTGFTRTTRTADALAMSLYPSRGIHLNGFEIKASRSDWVRELKDPDKAEGIAQFCSFWWVVAPEKVVTKEEVPMEWGLLELAGEKIRVTKPAVFHEAAPLTRPILASIFRNVSTGMIPSSRIQKDIADAVERDREQRRSQADYEIEKLKKDLEKYREFEALSGIKVEGWNLGNMAEIVKILYRNQADPDAILQSLEYVRNSVSGLSKGIDRTIEALKSAQESRS